MDKVTTMVAKAIREVQKQKLGEAFIVQDLFSRAEWEELSRTEKLHLGRQFLYRVDSLEPNIHLTRKTEHGQQIYMLSSAWS